MYVRMWISTSFMYVQDFQPQPSQNLFICVCVTLHALFVR